MLSIYSFCYILYEFLWLKCNQDNSIMIPTKLERFVHESNCKRIVLVNLTIIWLNFEHNLAIVIQMGNMTFEYRNVLHFFWLHFDPNSKIVFFKCNYIYASFIIVESVQNSGLWVFRCATLSLWISSETDHIISRIVDYFISLTLPDL